ncbi:MAG: ShlB/FhaC/HecB family hemolysin secretion/activation protein [Nostoc sp. TH1S01]|nr:ShlB/FhaC/HecB family hemolysin secretion/activation protein [Nostoc sp. TH1S01]
MSLLLLASLITTNFSPVKAGVNEVALENPPTIQQSPKVPSPLFPTPTQPFKIPPSVPFPLPAIPQPNIYPKLKVSKFIFKGNTVFSNQELEKQLAPFIGKPISYSDLTKISETITNYYVEQGYINSGAYIPIADNQSLKIDDAVVTVAIIEGQIEKINIISGGRLYNYIRARIPQPILNNKRLLSALQLLQQDPLIEKISSNLKSGSTASKAVLNIYVQPRKEFNANINLNNYRSPAVGSFERRIELSDSNLLGLGDPLNVAYRNTNGSSAIIANYSLPINSQNGTISFLYANVSNNIIEEPFTTLDIVSTARLYELSYRQPILRQASATSAQEFALGITASRLESESSLQNTPFPLSAGADPNGNTRISASKTWQENGVYFSLNYQLF